MRGGFGFGIVTAGRPVRWRVCLVLLCLPFFLRSEDVRGQELELADLQAGVRASVRIVSTGDQSHVGTGVIVHPRGLVLTTYDSVGYLRAAPGVLPGSLRSGSLRSGDNEYILMASNRLGEPAQARWVAEVVQGDLHQNFALLLVRSDLQGRSLGSGTRLPFVPLAKGTGSGPLRVGAPTWLFGFSERSAGAQVHRRSVARRTRDGLDELLTYQLDEGLPSGLSGGLAVDSKGSLVGLVAPRVDSGVGGAVGQGESIHVQPLSRINPVWKRRVVRGQVGTPRLGAERLVQGYSYEGVLAGQGSHSVHFYGLPARADGSGDRILHVDPPFQITVLDRKGSVLQAANGRLVVPEGAAVVGVDNSTKIRGSGTYRIWIAGATEGGAEGEDEVPPLLNLDEGAMRDLATSNEFADTDLGDGARVAGTSRFDQGANAWGSLHDAATGRPLTTGRIVVARPGTFMRDHLTAYLTGRITEREFREPLLGRARVDFRGRFDIPGLPEQRVYPAAAFAPGYRPAFFEVRTRPGLDDIYLGRIRLTR